MDFASSDGRERRRALRGAMLCSALEWYDFTVFGVLAVYISRAFFPGGDPDAALLMTFALFGVSFVLRPLGGLVIGWFGDRRGRKPALLLTLAMMAAGTLAIGLLPTYRTAGVAAPLLLLAARMVQGFSAGGEWGVANAFLVEWAPEGRRGLWTSFLSVTVAAGSLAANGVSACLITLLPEGAMSEWGWRVPFLVGGLLGAAALWLRASLGETPVYRRSSRAEPAAVRNGLGRGLLVFGLSAYWTISYYVFFIYVPAFTQAQTHLGPARVVWVNALGLGVIIALAPLVGRLSDRHGRRPFLLASCCIALLTTVPAFWLIANVRSLAAAIAVQLLFGGANALFSGAAPALLAELFPNGARSQGGCVSYALATALFGGFAPFIAQWLVGRTGSPLAPTAYVMTAAVVAAVLATRIRETAFLPLGMAVRTRYSS